MIEILWSYIWPILAVKRVHEVIHILIVKMRFLTYLLIKVILKEKKQKLGSWVVINTFIKNRIYFF